MLKITYYTGIKKACGWRSELVTATAEPISDKMCRVVTATMDDTKKSARQAFNAHYWSRGEVGKKKRISQLNSWEVM